jgi:hypothetical protein
MTRLKRSNEEGSGVGDCPGHFMFFFFVFSFPLSGRHNHHPFGWLLAAVLQ